MLRALPLCLLLASPALGSEVEARLPEDAWATRFHGLHAVNGDCADPDAVWAFAPGTVEMGRTICTALGKMIWQEGWLMIPVSQCSRMGEPVEPGWVALRDAGEAVIAAVAPDGSDVRLGACPAPG